MKKILILSFVLFGFLFCLSGCVDVPVPVVDVEALSEDSSFLFEQLGSAGDNVVYYRDCVTDVMYVCYTEKFMNAGFGGLSVMLDPQSGLPLTYERYCEMKKVFEGENP